MKVSLPLLLLLSSVAHAEETFFTTISFAWNAVEYDGPLVYQVHYGHASRDYIGHDTFVPNEGTVVQLDPNVEWFFAVRACEETLQSCSGFSNELSYRFQLIETPSEFVSVKIKSTLNGQ